MFLSITGSFILVEYENVKNIVQILSDYNLVYSDRSYVTPVIGNTFFSAKKVGANAYKTTGRA